MKTVRELIKEAESKLDDEHKDVNVAKVLFYHLAKKEPHELYLMMNEEVEPELEKAFLVGMEEYYQGKPIQYIKGKETFFSRDFINFGETFFSIIQRIARDSSSTRIAQISRTSPGVIFLT